ncbi:MAG: hypothetical protein OEZ14_02935, partial [Acidimicrobiia bacterium]|nr:hypothetical protein [Acidimicrobiia bacterium]
MLWRERYKMASSALLFSAALLAVFDYLARDASDRGPSILYLALAMVFAGIYAFFTDWAKLPSLLRLLPAVLVLAAMMASIYWADSSGTPHAVIGFAAAAILVLS